jgi:1,4-dihydroxy-2-naphthoyl-CoA synthase
MWASLAEASRAMSLITASPEWREGMSAFMEKRPPDFGKLASQV